MASPWRIWLVANNVPQRRLLQGIHQLNMEDSTFVLAIIPPSLAIVAELYNPISHSVLDKQSLSTVDTMGLVSLAQDNNPDGDLGRYTREKRAISDGILFVAKGAVESAGLIPTWISVSTSAAAIFHEIAKPAWWYVSVFVATSIFAIAASVFFGRTSFLSLTTRPHRGLCFGATGEKCLSRIIIALNAVLIILCLSVWLLSKTRSA
jgi:hypothetical protein